MTYIVIRDGTKYERFHNVARHCFFYKEGELTLKLQFLGPNRPQSTHITLNYHITRVNRMDQKRAVWLRSSKCLKNY